MGTSLVDESRCLNVGLKDLPLAPVSFYKICPGCSPAQGFDPQAARAGEQVKDSGVLQLPGGEYIEYGRPGSLRGRTDPWNHRTL
jgi:hypothetical protein